jgi:hypothetical protein
MMKKTEREGFLRDDNNHALINTNVSAYKQYINQRESQNKVRSLESEVDSLKDDISDIKQMLSILIKQNNKEN